MKELRIKPIYITLLRRLGLSIGGIHTYFYEVGPGRRKIVRLHSKATVWYLLLNLELPICASSITYLPCYYSPRFALTHDIGIPHLLLRPQSDRKYLS